MALLASLPLGQREHGSPLPGRPAGHSWAGRVLCDPERVSESLATPGPGLALSHGPGALPAPLAGFRLCGFGHAPLSISRHTARYQPSSLTLTSARGTPLSSPAGRWPRGEGGVGGSGPARRQGSALWTEHVPRARARPRACAGRADGGRGGCPGGGGQCSSRGCRRKTCRGDDNDNGSGRDGRMAHDDMKWAARRPAPPPVPRCI